MQTSNQEIEEISQNYDINQVPVIHGRYIDRVVSQSFLAQTHTKEETAPPPPPSWAKALIKEVGSISSELIAIRDDVNDMKDI